MIGKIGPLVQGAPNRTPALAALHILGGALGGATMGVALGFVGVILRATLPGPAAATLALGLPLVLLYAGLVDLRLLRFSLPTTGRQTPSEWTCTLGPLGAIFGWGYDLGLGLTTSIYYRATLVLPAYALLAGNLPAAIAPMILFGGARAGAVIIAVAASRGQAAATCDRVTRQADFRRGLVGGLGLSLGIVLALLPAAIR